VNPRYGIIGVIVVLFVIAVVALSSSLYTVSETELVVITQFGKPIVGSEKTGPGLHFKTPFIQNVRRMEKRLIAWLGAPNKLVTKDKKSIYIETFARWRIADTLRFYTSTRGGDINLGQKQLDDIVDSIVRNVVSRYDLVEVVRSTDRDLVFSKETTEAEKIEQEAKIEVGRDRIVAEIRKLSSARLEEALGIEIADVRIKRINYVDKVRPDIYNRMSAERKKIAELYISQGEGEANSIRGTTQQELLRIQGEAEERAATIKGQADAQAIKIYGDAIAKTKDFFEFLRTLEAYKASMDRNTTLVLSTESDFLRFLKSIKAEPTQ
jgi:membrane protease subunit HflC